MRNFLIAFVSIFLLLIPLKHPSSADWASFAHFTFVEVGQHLFLKFSWVPFVLYYAYNLKIGKIFGRDVVWGGWFLFGCYQWFRFVNYYFLGQLIPDSIAKSLNLHICKPEEGCVGGLRQMWNQEVAVFNTANKGSQLWVDDAVCVIVLTLIFIWHESKRWDIPNRDRYLAVTLLFGPDCALPFFFRELVARETGNKAPNKDKDLRWLYLGLAWFYLLLWMPNLWEWNKHVGLVTPQLHIGDAIPLVYRSTWLIMGAAFGVTILHVVDINVGEGRQGLVLSWLLRTLWMFCQDSNVAAGWAAVLYFRELSPYKSFKFDPAVLKPATTAASTRTKHA